MSSTPQLADAKRCVMLVICDTSQDSMTPYVLSAATRSLHQAVTAVLRDSVVVKGDEATWITSQHSPTKTWAALWHNNRSEGIWRIRGKIPEKEIKEASTKPKICLLPASLNITSQLELVGGTDLTQATYNSATE